MSALGLAARRAARGSDPRSGVAGGLERGLAALGLRLDAERQAQLVAYVALLAKWNRTYNLTAIREPAQMVTHHLLDSLAVLPHLPHRAGVRLLDIGAGGGLPGIPLAIARPQWRVTLVEPNQKKAAFLTQVAIEVALQNVEVCAIRVEDLAPGARFDVAICRAYADLATFARGALPHLAPGGELVAMKGVLPQDEIAALPREVAVTATPALAVPGLDAARHLVVMRRASEPERA